MSGADSPRATSVRPPPRSITRRPILGASLAVALTGGAARGAPLSASWVQVRAAARAEGKVVVYSTLPDDVWRILAEAFAQAEPGVAIDFVRIPSIAGLFDRYEHEAASHTPTADLLVANEVEAWARLSSSGALAPFRPPHAEGLPPSSFTADIFTFALEPQALFFSSVGWPFGALPDSLEAFAVIAAANAEALRGRIVAYDPFQSPFACLSLWRLARLQGERFWTSLEAIGPLARLSMAAPAMLADIGSGKALASLYIPEVFAAAPAAASAGLRKVRPRDGVPAYPRSFGVPRATAHPNAARLLADFLLSQAGQAAIGRGGDLPLRPVAGTETFADLRAAMGDSLAVVTHDLRFARERDAFLARLRRCFQP